MTNQELTYWVTLALMPKMWTRRKNEIYAKCFTSSPRISIVDLFEDSSVWGDLGLTQEEADMFMEAHSQLANNSFLVENLLSQGYDILPIHSDDYPSVLKENLKSAAPAVIFTKGNKLLLKEAAIAVVGSRNADDISLKFTDNVARSASSEKKVVVSGFAKGVDRQALDSALECGGKSIIVLPQGIMTFSSGFRQYYKHITQGRVLVMSSFAPKAPWTKEFAMARNPIIYGMASEIYVAQSDNKGGTWSGVIDGLRKNRTIYVRHPEAGEKNANMELIAKGAVAVDLYGKVCEEQVPAAQLSSESNGVASLWVCEAEAPAYSSAADEQKNVQAGDALNVSIVKLLSSGGTFGLKEIRLALNVQLSDAKLRSLMDSVPGVRKFKEGRRVLYCLISAQPGELTLDFE